MDQKDNQGTWEQWDLLALKEILDLQELLVTEEPQGHKGDLDRRAHRDHLAIVVRQDNQESQELRARVALVVNQEFQAYQEDREYLDVTAYGDYLEPMEDLVQPVQLERVGPRET